MLFRFSFPFPLLPLPDLRARGCIKQLIMFHINLNECIAFEKKKKRGKEIEFVPSVINKIPITTHLQPSKRHCYCTVKHMKHCQEENENVQLM